MCLLENNNMHSAGEWSDSGYHVIRVGKETSSVRALCVVAGNIWAAYKNCIVVLDGESLQIVVRIHIVFFTLFRKSLLPIPERTVRCETCSGLELEFG